MYRLSKTFVEVCGHMSHASRSFFWCSLLPVLSYSTATCEAILSVKEWNRKMKIKQKKCTVVIKKLCSACISDKKTKSVHFKLRPLLPVFTPLPNTVYTFFYFQGLRGGHDTVPEGGMALPRHHLRIFANWLTLSIFFFTTMSEGASQVD